MSDDPRILGLTIRYWEGLSNVATVVAVLGAVVGGFLALAEYYESQRARTVAVALDHVDRWETDGAAAAWRCLESRVSGELSAQSDLVNRATQRRAAGLTDAFDEVYATVSGAVLDDTNTCANLDATPAAAFDKVVAHLGRVALCVEAGACHLPTIRTYYQSVVDDLHAIFAASFRDLSQRRPRQTESLANLRKQVTGDR